ncbi:unnamed protein product [Owenia fusiformis]|uniref:Uncharacterized protein n=1 Tax=Owenia fusiformis TaxID=6347 RepID=A0A8S4PBD3_OWEFU|nr:unnamed protein product [Owenia fusiformis]
MLTDGPTDGRTDQRTDGHLVDLIGSLCEPKTTYPMLFPQSESVFNLVIIIQTKQTSQRKQLKVRLPKHFIGDDLEKTKITSLSSETLSLMGIASWEIALSNVKFTKCKSATEIDNQSFKKTSRPILSQDIWLQK